MDARVSPVLLGQEFAQAVADDALSLALVHDRELSVDMLVALREHAFPFNLALVPSAPASRPIWESMAQALATMAWPVSSNAIDDLAAEYASIYFNGAYQASPYESVWLDEEHLMCQQPMFDLRRIYADAGLAVEHWRQRPDDHFVFQLLYIAHCAQHANTPQDWQVLAAFMDDHWMRWFPDFAARIAQRTASPFYAMLMQLTAAWAMELRSAIGPLPSTSGRPKGHAKTIPISPLS